MKKVTALGLMVIGAAVVCRATSPASRRRLTGAMQRRVLQRMETMMAKLPEDSPPRLIMAVLPRLRKQNDQIIAMLREQNELLRARRHEDQLSTALDI